MARREGAIAQGVEEGKEEEEEEADVSAILGREAGDGEVGNSGAGNGTKVRIETMKKETKIVRERI